MGDDGGPSSKPAIVAESTSLTPSPSLNDEDELLSSDESPTGEKEKKVVFSPATPAEDARTKRKKRTTRFADEVETHFISKRSVTGKEDLFYNDEEVKGFRKEVREEKIWKALLILSCRLLLLVAFVAVFFKIDRVMRQLPPDYKKSKLDKLLTLCLALALHMYLFYGRKNSWKSKRS
eukprot:CAMPEP_0185730132 /NCGR_PEP_ID=MMETSP1171-20130828/8692_1 /TAXON_ID=374046 /ORGANISM="Helicotheca tamensis, Strain CCMP826" /LENGTH=177 /DNA_ID=CAMNT_0028399127 /DNA_START=27 /DNA_END=560 /DNA_ORIENTATION=+